MLKKSEFSIEECGVVYAQGVNGLIDGAEVLHAACGIYTRPIVVDMILDAVGWRSEQDLFHRRLLEPASGDGAFVVAAAERLLQSFAVHSRALQPDFLTDRILAFEIHANEAAKCRAAVIQLLIKHGLTDSDAKDLAAAWVKEADFLMWPLMSGSFTHVVGNPPYLRWSKLPTLLRSRYEQALPRTAARGDLFLPFLDRGIEALKVGGKLGFVCTDRWKFMAFAEAFRNSRLPEVDLLEDRVINPAEAYIKAASTYPSVVIMQRRRVARKPISTTSRGLTLKEAGFEVRVGPALGFTPAYVLPLESAEEVEEELLRPWLSPSDVRDGWSKTPSKVVICLHDSEGRLLDLEKFPKTRAWLSRYRKQLEQRSIVMKQGAVWYRPIDKVSAEAWKMPKLLVPELSKTPRVAMDATGAVPAHGLYVIRPTTPSADIVSLFDRLSGGGLATQMERISPRANGGYLRCYKRFLQEIVLA